MDDFEALRAAWFAGVPEEALRESRASPPSPFRRVIIFVDNAGCWRSCLIASCSCLCDVSSARMSLSRHNCPLAPFRVENGYMLGWMRARFSLVLHSPCSPLADILTFLNLDHALLLSRRRHSAGDGATGAGAAADGGGGCAGGQQPAGHQRHHRPGAARPPGPRCRRLPHPPGPSPSQPKSNSSMCLHHWQFAARVSLSPSCSIGRTVSRFVLVVLGAAFCCLQLHQVWGDG